MIDSPASETAVVLLNLGGPSTLDEVEPFLVNLFSDRDIIQLPGGGLVQPAFARLIARLRGPSVRRNYESIGGGSPQLRITEAQSSALEAVLNGNGENGRYRTFIAMRYSRPTADDALDAIVQAGIRRVVTLPLFPHYSAATTGSSLREFERAQSRRQDAGLQVTHIKDYADEPAYLDAMTETVRNAWRRIPFIERLGTVLVFSAHGLPQRFIDGGDPYVKRIMATMHGIRRRLALPNRYVLAYQSRTGPVKWIGPGTEETIRTLGREGVTSVLVAPLSFVSDHIETLYEVDQLFAETARNAGITGYYRSAALNESPRFIKGLATLVQRHVSGRQPSAGPAGGVAVQA